MTPNARLAARAASRLVLAGLVACALAPGAARAARRTTIGYTLGLSGLYDSDILQYSDGQIADFESGLNPARFSLQTTDDFVLVPSLAVTAEIDEGRGRRHLLRVRTEGDFHDRNATADMHTVSVGWRETFRHDRQLSAGYYAMPRYYLRQLFAEDWTAVPASVRYRRAEFSLGIASAGYGQRLGADGTLGLDYQYEHRGYNPDFAERTSNLHQGRLSLGWNGLGRHGGLRGYGGYRTSHARGTDGDEAVGSPSDDSDVSYHGAIAGAGVRYEWTRSGNLRLGSDLGYEFEGRDYTSTLVTDRYHFGRHDRLNAVEVGVRAALRPHLAVRGYYRHENNVSHLGASAPLSTDAGSYHLHQFGLDVEWSGDLWIARRARRRG